MTLLMMNIIPKKDASFNIKLVVITVLLSCFLKVNAQVIKENEKAIFTEDLKLQQSYEITKQEKKDSLKFVFKNRWLVGFHNGYFIMPNYVAAETDKLTGVDLKDAKRILGLSVEYFINNKFALGLETTIQQARQVIKFTTGPNGSSININGGGGTTSSSFLYGKYFFNNLQSPVTDKILFNTNPYVHDISEELNSLNSKNSRLMRKPRLYSSFGIGLVKTTLIKVSGDPSMSVSLKNYEQSVLSGKLGIGVLSRLSKIVVNDVSCQYIFSKPYNPSIGSVTSYSGFRFDIKIAIILNGGFRSTK